MASPIYSGSLVEQAQAGLDAGRGKRLLAQLRPEQGTIQDTGIDKGAKEFEAMLLSSWLQQAEESMATVPGAEDDEEMSGRQQMMGLGVQSLSTALVASGGIGIAGMIEKALRKATNGVDSAPQAGAGSLQNEKIHDYP